jgi:hypothetical protein
MKLDWLLPRFLRRWLKSARRDAHAIRALRKEVHEAKMLAARLLIEQHRQRGRLERLSDAEFKVFSQFGDDGIIQYLTDYLEVTPRTFVEFGVEDYSEANTRFLLLNDNWRGLVLDGSSQSMEALRGEELYWRQDLTAVSAFIDRDNINGLLTEQGFCGPLGILSIDIDGNDYWVWERIDCVSPAIVIAEYNSVFGAEHPVSVPYDPRFVRSQAHYSHLYWGCSLPALCVLAERKGFSLVGCNSHGNNAYFVRRDRMRDLRPLTAAEGFVESRFRESRDEHGRLTFLAGADRRRAIAEMVVVDVVTGRRLQVAELGSAIRSAGSRADAA